MLKILFCRFVHRRRYISTNLLKSYGAKVQNTNNTAKLYFINFESITLFSTLL